MEVLNKDHSAVEEQKNIDTNPNPKPADDLLSRVSRFMEDNPPKPEVDKDPEYFDLKDIEGIKDPVAKEEAMKAYKSFQRGFNKKFQELAELKKQFQNQPSSLDSSGQWTPEKVQQLINDPTFVQAAQALNGNQQTTDDDVYSNLSEIERAKMMKLEREINELKSQNSVAMRKQEELLRQQQHEQYKAKYANYDPKKIDEITVEMLEGKIQPTPEHIYKAFFHDDNVRKAYELGRKDEREGITEKFVSSSASSKQTMSSEDSISPEKDEDPKKFLDRVIQKNLKLWKSRQGATNI